MTIPQQLRRGLVAYWPLNESSGGAPSALYAADGPYDLADNNTVTNATGPSDNLLTARSFASANSEHLNSTDSALTLSGGPFTITGWLNGTTLGSANRGVLSKDASGQREFFIRVTATQRLGIELFDTSNSLIASTNTGASSISTSTWYFFFVRFNGTNVEVSVDHGLSGSQFDSSSISTAINNATSEFRVGAREFSTAESFWDGAIANITFHRRALANAETFWLYNNGSGRNLLRGV